MCTTHQADCLAKLNAILEESIAAGVPGLSVEIASSRGHWTLTAGVSDGLQAIEPTHVFGIGSITKVFTAVVIFQLIEEGKLHLSDTVCRILGSEIYRDIDDAAEATVAQLLSHTAGIDSWEDDSLWIREGRGSKLDPTHIWDKVEPLGYIRRPKITAPSRGDWYYANTNYTLLGLMIEKITQSTAEAEIRRRILEPLAMEHTFLEGFEPPNQGKLAHRYQWATDTFRDTAGICPSFPGARDGRLIDCTKSNLSVEWVAGGMVSSASDLTKFAVALRDGRLLSSESLDIMTTWRPATDSSEMGHGIFRRRDHGTNAWLGHFGGVLGFTGALWWKEEGDCVISVLSNVGTMHAGKVPSSAAHVIIDSNILEIASQLAAA
ncbi:uncharacterized protein TRUGW13939_08200 [Talaromyces rugulosus]|uniref:Beta-lactamase-related domain-containing protein n=1 Tax=Talaromyces rugulosus TaxID=121627 RepID=A0A7H8R3X6_TALRU|nr:uncharacterized protein TRUGW13939_08200 [Talaromyces rugulosus]QKX61054.1 hypothetical protein TRUGW13939_08200 [Talaromyces rugulosus]